MREGEPDVLIQKMIRGDINNDEIKLLRAALLSSEALRLRYVEAMDLYASMFTLAESLDDDDDRQAPNRWLNPQIGGPRARRIGWALVATFMLILIGFFTGMFLMEGREDQEGKIVASPVVPVVRAAEPGPIVAWLAGSKDVEWVDGPDQAMTTEFGGWRVGEQVGLHSGLATVRLKSGVLCCFDGECLLKIDAANRVFLAEGRVAFHVPKGAEGFVVATPAGTIEDLGTTFGVSVGPRGVDAQVMNGAIAVDPNFGGAAGPPFRMEVNSAVRLDTNRNTVSAIQFNRFHYHHALAFKAGVTAMSSNIRFRWSPIESGLLKELGVSNQAVLLREKSSKRLTNDLVYFDDNRQREVRIPAGTIVDSFLLHFSPAASMSMQGEIEFKTDILGVLCQSEDLGRTDAAFMPNPDNMDMSPATEETRGSDEPEDSVSVDSTGRILRMNVACNIGKKISLDQIRVLVRASQE